MTRRRWIPLNPCDYLIYSLTARMRREGQGDCLAMMFVEVEGEVPPDRIRRAFAGALAAHPVTLADLRVSRVDGRPYWRLPDCSSAAARHASAASAAASAYSFHDLRGRDDWAARLEALVCDRMTPWRDPHRGPQVYLDHYALPAGRTRFCLRWQHYFMDAEGAQLLLAEIERHDGCEAGEEPSGPPGWPVLPEGEGPDPLAGAGFSRRLWMAARATRRAIREGSRSGQLIAAWPAAAITGHGLLYRAWPGEVWERVRAAAQRHTPPGPGRYARYFVACTTLALHRLHRESGRETAGYLITLPLRVTLPDGRGGNRVDRPICGNYLTAVTLRACREDLADLPTLAASFQGQLQSYLDGGGDRVMWSLMWLLSRMRTWMQRAVLRGRSARTPLSSGFSYYGEAAAPVRRFGGQEVANIWGAGLVATPPGWNPVFCRYRERLSFSMAFNLPSVSAAVARRYQELIESEVFARCE